MKIRGIKQKNPIVEMDGEVRLPIFEYQTVISVRDETVFNGRTMPMPEALFEYLSGSEMKVFAIILRHQREHGCCIIKTTTMAKAIGVTHISIANTLARLKKMGIIHYEVAGKKRDKVIDWDAIAVLDQMSAKWKAGGLTALRKKLKDKNINRIVPENYKDIRAQFEINSDPIENEEYD